MMSILNNVPTLYAFKTLFSDVHNVIAKGVMGYIRYFCKLLKAPCGQKLNGCRGLLFLVIIGVAVFLRVNDLYKYDLWFDELVSDKYSYIRYERAGVRGVSFVQNIWSSVKRDFQPPLYYGVVYFFTALFSQDKALRILSVIFSILSLIVFYRIARRFLGKGESLGALAIMAWSPFHIWYAQEQRGYAMACFFFLVAVNSWLNARAGKQWIRWWLFLIMLLLALLSSYFAVALLFIAAFFAIAEGRPWFNRRVLIFWAVLGVVITGFAPLIGHQLMTYTNWASWLKLPVGWQLLVSPSIFVMGYLFNMSFVVISTVVVWVFLLRGALTLRSGGQDRCILLLLSWVPLFLIFCLSYIWRPVYLDRQFIIFAPFFYILIVRGVGSIRKGWVRWSGAILLSVCLIMAFNSYRHGGILNDVAHEFYPGVHSRKEYGGLIDRIRKKIKSGDKIITADIQASSMVEKYLGPESQAPSEILFLNKLDLIAEFEKLYLRVKIKGNLSSGLRNDDLVTFIRINGVKVARKFEPQDLEGGRIWFVASSWDRNHALSSNAFYVQNMLRHDFEMTRSYYHHGVVVQLYEKKLSGSI